MELFLGQGKPDDAKAHIEQTKPYAADSAYNQDHAMEQQAKVWYFQHKAEDAKSEALRVLGAALDLERCTETLWGVQVDHKFISPHPAFLEIASHTFFLSVSHTCRS